MAGPGRPENLAQYRNKRSIKNARKVLNNINKPGNIKKQRLTYVQRNMNEDNINEYLDDIAKKIKDTDKDNEDPFKTLDLNSRSNFANTCIRFVQMKQDRVESEQEDKEFDEVIKDTKALRKTRRRNKKDL